MSYAAGIEGYYTKMLDLQEKLRRSEEERLKLEEKFNEIMRFSRDAEHERLRILRHKYHRFLEEDRIRQDRNENILRALDRIESRAKMFSAKTNRFKALRNQYEAYTRRIYATQKQQPIAKASNFQYAQSHTSQSCTNTRKLLFSDLPTTGRSETKIAMLEQYLQDNFNNFPNDRSLKHRESVLNENRLLNEQNNYSPNYSLPEEYSQNVDDIRQNYSHPEIVMDSELKHKLNYEEEDHFLMHKIDSHTAQKTSEFTKKFPGNDIQQFRKTEKSQLLGNTIEKELARLCEIESAKQMVDHEKESNVSKDCSSDPYVQSYKDLVSESAKKLGLPNRSLVGSPKKMSNQIMEKHDDDKLNLPINVLNTTKNFDIIEEDLVEIQNKKLVEQQENHSIKNEKVNIEKYKEPAQAPKEHVLNEENSKEEILSEQKIVQTFSPKSKDNKEVLPIMEKLEVFEQDNNVDLTSKTPEVNSGRTDRRDDITLTTPSPIHLSLARQNTELPTTESKKSPIDINQSDSTSQLFSNSKDIQNINNVSLQNTSKEQSQSSGDDISLIHAQQMFNNQNDSVKQQTVQKLEDNKNDLDPEVHENDPIETRELQSEYQKVHKSKQSVHDNQAYENAKQYVEGEPQEKYNPENSPFQKHTEGPPDAHDSAKNLIEQQYLADEERYPVDQVQYSADEQQYAIDQQYFADQKQYPVNQQHYSADQDYRVGEQQYLVDQKYDVDQQQYAADEQQLSINQQQYGADQQQLSADQQQNMEDQLQYSVDHQQYTEDQQQYTEDQQQYTENQEQYPTDEQQYLAEQQQYKEDQQLYPVDQQQYLVDQQQYSVDQQQYSVEQQQSIEDQQKYTEDHQQYPTDQQKYKEDQQQYTEDQQQYPVDQQQYPAEQQQYKEDQQQYTEDQQQYKEDHQQYPTEQQQYIKDQEQYPAEQQQYPIDQQQYPIDAQQFPIDQQKYPANQQQYQEEYSLNEYSEEPKQYIGQPKDYDPTQYPQNYATDKAYPDGEYDSQQYPERYNQEVYRSEQEYLQGEQNIDVQYQSEVTSQEYQEQYPLQEAVSDPAHQREELVTSRQSLNESVKNHEVKLEKTLPIEQDISESIEKTATRDIDIVQPEDKALVEKKLPNLVDMLDTDSESTKQETKISNESDFDFTNT